MKHNTLVGIVAGLFVFGISPGQPLHSQETAAAAKPEQQGQAALDVAAQDDSAGPTQEQIEKLAKYLTGAKLTGQFTVTGRGEMAPKPETYWIEKAEKNPEGDKWTITARIQYGSNDVKVPMAMDIKWAGGTPVITVDQLTIIGMGTFDARVLFRGGLYAGTWRHDDVGGHLFGTVTTAEEQAKEAADKSDGVQPVSLAVPVLPCKETGSQGGN